MEVLGAVAASGEIGFGDMCEAPYTVFGQHRCRFDVEGMGTAGMRREVEGKRKRKRKRGRGRGREGVRTRIIQHVYVGIER